MQGRDLTRGALTGLRVVDLSRVLAGPLCTQMLADHGADVVKLEPPAGDETRQLGPPFDDEGQAAYFGAVNRGKRSMALDLSREQGRAVLEALLKDADVLVENFVPGTMETLGSRIRGGVVTALSAIDLLRHLGFWRGRAVRGTARL